MLRGTQCKQTNGVFRKGGQNIFLHHIDGCHEMAKTVVLKFWTINGDWHAFINLVNNSLGPKFSSQGHFHSLQLLNASQFLFSRLVRLKTAPRGDFSHA